MFTFPKNRMSQKAPMAVVLLFCLMVFFLVATSLLLMAINGKFTNPVAGLRISAVIQDLLIFIVPAIAVAMLSTRYPASLLSVDKLPDLKITLMALATLIVSVPAMNLLVEWNQNIKLPESMAAIETAMRGMEKAAADTINLLFKEHSVGALIVNVLIIGVLAGFSEELFFRGALQRLLTVGGRNIHLMIWVTAFVFSAFHLQFYGFVPRLLLGAFFGYLLCWTGSLWLPILIHAVNNSIVVITQWNNNGGENGVDINKIGAEGSDAGTILLVAGSVLCTLSLLYLMKRRSDRLAG